MENSATLFIRFGGEELQVLNFQRAKRPVPLLLQPRGNGVARYVGVKLKGR